ncbi:MAG: MSHA biogenesis protein MshQ [Bradyrhizobium sp.]|jgi:MSHA biogenesis protein MshQ
MTVRALDSDGVSSAIGTGSVEGGVMVVSGRLLLMNNFGSELLTLPVKVLAQYWDGRHFASSATDNASSFARSDVKLDNCSGTLRSGTTCKAAVGLVATPLSFVLNSGATSLTLAATGPGNTGSVDLRITSAAWLPSTMARLRAGATKAGPIIYLRELY